MLLKLKSVLRGKITRAILVAVVFGAAVLFIADRLFPLPKERMFRQPSHFVYSREGQLLRAFSSSDRFWRKPVGLEEISSLMLKSVLVSEDRWFYYHPGFNPFSIFAAAYDNIRAGRTVRGGSTITMQIARMIEPKERTVLNKFVELLRAVQLELHYDKDELLEMYLNMLPYGGNIEGIGAASLLYFDKTPAGLSLAEIATLTAIPVRPSDFRPDADPEKCRARRNRVLENLFESGVIERSEYDDAVDEEIPLERRELPFIAPHFCQYQIDEEPDKVVINSTIDDAIQLFCERIARQSHFGLKQKGANNLSVVVIDNRTGELLAMVGSPDFYDRSHDGQVNGALAPRSPGSALKPFVYGLAFERGLISPELKVEDIPVDYAGYEPVNYDNEYHGVVSVREALINSFNIPAVNILSEVGLKRLYDLLEEGGISTLDRKYYKYGLPLILGAAEVNLLELSNLYASLGRSGVWKPLITDSDAKSDSLVEILSPEASFLLSDILSGLQRPDLPGSWEFTMGMPKIAWKTGTSYGRRDAWTIGYNPRFTVGVWAGNFSGEGSSDIVGAEIAAPVMFDIFNELSKGLEPVWFEVPDGVGVRKVSGVSGMLPNEFCSKTINEYYIRGVSPVKRDNIETRIFVDNKSGLRLGRDCLHGRDYREEIVQNWPPRLAGWLAEHGTLTGIPPLDPQCRGSVIDDAPVIVSPEPGSKFVLVKYLPNEYQNIMLEAESITGENLHWFIDNRHYATARSGEKLFYTPEPGVHEIMCVDNRGRSHSLTFEVN